MLKLDEVIVSFDKHKVLNKLCLSLSEGKVHGLAGLNGSGKTTLLNCLYGFLKPDSGSILWNGKPLTRHEIVYLETNNYFYSNITGREYLSVFPENNANFDLKFWQDLLQLPLDELIDNYSTGMKKKLALLAILKLDRPLMIFDEPFNGLDLETGKILVELIQKLKEKGKTIIITSHILDTLLNSCDEIHWLRNGRIEKTFFKPEFQQIDHTIFEDLKLKKLRI